MPDALSVLRVTGIPFRIFPSLHAFGVQHQDQLHIFTEGLLSSRCSARNWGAKEAGSLGVGWRCYDVGDTGLTGSLSPDFLPQPTPV